ncbi:DUF3987 domain-containing protein [Humibacillus xanthopallidus]|uniref:DUF3987 domain-containing protein n=1 Tax=Humibacillus xanthopallidus TaxID=412689 RepID=UPI00384E11AD
MYYGLLGRNVEAVDPTTEADKAGVLGSLMAGVGVLIGPGPHLQIGNTRHPLLISPLLVGRTGAGRKGEATSSAMIVLRAADPELDTLTATGLSSGEGLIERIRDPDEGDEGGGPKSRRAGTEDKRLLVIEPEFARAMICATRPGNTLSPVLRAAWDGGPLQVLTRNQIRASSSHVAVVGHITPQEFRRRMSARDLAGGTYNRLLPLYVERSKMLPLPPGMSEALKSQLGRELSDAIGRTRGMGKLTLDGDAERLWGEIHADLSALSEDESAWGEFIQRAAPHTLRIAALYAVLDGVDKISEDHLNAAWALVRYSMESAHYLLGDLSGDRKLDKIRKAIDEAPEQP